MCHIYPQPVANIQVANNICKNTPLQRRGKQATSDQSFTNIPVVGTGLYVACPLSCASVALTCL